MPFINSHFGSYSNYQSWNNGRDNREYIIELTNEDTSETYIVLNNPTGITKFGLNLSSSDTFNSLFQTASLSLSFEKKAGGGGEFIKSAYDTSGIRANILCDVYKKNPDTNDFDILYNYKVDYQDGSYLDDIYYIDCKLRQVGLIQKVTSRANLDIDITKNISIDGDTITDVSTSEIYIPPVDVYLYGEASEGLMIIDDTYFSGGTTVVTQPYHDGIQKSDQTNGRINFYDPTDGKIYVNDSGESKDIKFTANFVYIVTSNFVSPNTLDLYLDFNIYNELDVLIFTKRLATFTNNSEGEKTESQTISHESSYQSIGDNGYAVLEMTADISAITSSYIESANIEVTEDSNFEIIERSNSIATTPAIMYKYEYAMLKLLRLITGIDDCFYWDTSNELDMYVTSGWFVRRFTGKDVTVNLTDLFKSGDFLESLGLGYDSVTNRFYLAKYADFHQSTEIIDFGVVENFKLSPTDEYYNSLLTGSNEDGNYEKRQGVQEFNIQANHGTTFERDSKKNIRVPYVIDTLNIEYTRRLQYSTDGQTDTKQDSSIFIFNVESGVIPVNNYLPTGFYGVEQYMNLRYNYRECIKRNGGKLGMFWKDSDESISFRNSKKNVDINYTPPGEAAVNLNHNINQDELSTPLHYPEKQEFEAVVTLDDIDTILSNPYGYYKCTDILGNVFYGDIKELNLLDFEEKLTIKGVTANTDR